MTVKGIRVDHPAIAASTPHSYITQITSQQLRQLADRSQQIRVVDDAWLAILIKAIERVLAIAILIFTDPRRTVSATDCRTLHRVAIDTRYGDSKNAFPVRTGRGAIERASLESQFRSAILNNATNDTAKTYDESGRNAHDAFTPDLRTDPELVAVVEAWAGLLDVPRTTIAELVTGFSGATCTVSEG